MKHSVILLLNLLVLASCSNGGEASSITSQAPSSGSESLVSSAAGSSATSEDPLLSSVPQPELSSEESIPSIESSQQEEIVQGPWELTADALPKNPASGTNHDIDFSILNANQQTISFRADCVLRGAGTKGDKKTSIDGTIQLSKNDGEGSKGYLYMTSGSASSIEFKTLKNFASYNQTDYSGVPEVYSADEMTASNGEKVELKKEETADGLYYVYTATLPHNRFRLESSSGNAIYLYYLKNLA